MNRDKLLEQQCLERAYIALLQLPHCKVRINNQLLLAGLRDALSAVLARDEESVQNEYEQRAALLSQQEQEPSKTAEEYLREKYGAYRAHHEWRALEEAFNAGRLAPPPAQGWNELSEHDKKIIQDVDAMAADRTNGFWPQALALGVQRILRKALARPSQAQEQQSQVGNFGDSAREQIDRQVRSLPLPNYSQPEPAASSAEDEPCPGCWMPGCNGECSGDGLLGG